MNTPQIHYDAAKGKLERSLEKFNQNICQK